MLNECAIIEFTCHHLFDDSLSFLCHSSACSGRSSERITFEDYSNNMRDNQQDLFKYLGTPNKTSADFFSAHSEAISLFSLESQHAVKQRAVTEGIPAKSVVFAIGGLKFIRAPVKHDWRLPSPLLSEEEYVSFLPKYLIQVFLNMLTMFVLCNHFSHHQF